MPSPWHDTPNDLFKDDIAATAEIVRLAGVDLPSSTRLWLGPNVFNTRPAKEFIADTVTWLCKSATASQVSELFD